MIVIGADTHKHNHTLVALDGQTGAARGQRAIAASDAGFLDGLRFAAGLDEERVWAIEDCRHVSARLEGALLAAGERVIRVPAAMTVQTRRVSRQAGKSDPIDARAVAMAAVRDGIESFPVAFTDAQAMEIRVLSDYRDRSDHQRAHPDDQPAALALGHDRTRARSPAGPSGTERPQDLRSADPSTRSAAAVAAAAGRPTAAEADHRDRPRATRAAGPARQLDRRLRSSATRAAWVRDGDRRDHHRPYRRRAAIPDRRALRPPRRHRTRPCLSGNTQRHRLHRGGNRQLNRAIHIIALSRARTDPATRAYLARKHAEGKTKREAIRCLKRHLARRIWRLLNTTQTPAAPPVQINRSNPQIPTFT